MASMFKAKVRPFGFNINYLCSYIELNKLLIETMKKLLTLSTLTLLTLILCNNQSNAQNSINVPEGFELGIRLGDTQGGALAIDAVIPFRGNRLRADLGLFDGFSVTGLHDWKFILNENFFWYTGAGAILDFEDDLDIAAAAEIGIEYILDDAPFTISIDWRPTIGFTDGNFGGNSFGINLRYTFQQSR